jgi:predicted ATPase
LYATLDRPDDEQTIFGEYGPLSVIFKTFGELLRQHRTAAGFSQAHLADLASISVESVGAIERGVRRAPYRDTVLLLAEALNLNDAERAELEAAANRARSRGSVARNLHLPLRSTSFIGRVDDIAAITALIDRNRLVTVTGSGGVGKTRATIEISARLPEDRWGGIRFVDLSPITDGAFVVGAIASALDASLSVAGLDDLIASLRSRRELLVLDNCEHLIDDVARVIVAVLQSCETVSFLATSRERLAISGEAVYRLPSLGLPLLSVPGLEEARKYAAVALFIERATAFDQGAAFTDADVDGIVEICRQLDGIPLAIELAAARVSTLGLSVLRSRLKQGLALTGGARDLPARQRTMLATIAWSYDLLEPAERSLLQRLSLFAGGFTLAAAESVCASGDVESSDFSELLSSLVDKSLVNVIVSRETTRYALLDSVRSFSAGQLSAAGETETFAQRHAEWIAAFGDWVDVARAGKPELWLRNEVDPELDNARAALAWALDPPSAERAELAGRIVGGLRTIWLTSGRKDECKRWATAVLDLIDDERHPQVVARLLRALIQAESGSASLVWVDRALATFERIGDRIGIALLHAHVAYNLGRRGMLAEADAAIARADEIFALVEGPRSMTYATFLQTRWQWHLQHGRYERALADIEEGTAIVNALGDTDALQWALFRAELQFCMGEHGLGIRTAESVMAEARTEPARRVREMLYGSLLLAQLRIIAGDLDGGRAAIRESLKLAQSKSDESTATTIDAVALLATRLGDPRQGAILYGAMNAYVQRTPVSTEAIAGGARSRILYLLQAELRERLAPEELQTLAAQGAAMTMDATLAEAMRV